MRVFLALPAYNEEEGLPHVLESFRSQLDHFACGGQAVIVDDGSRDGTDRVIREWSDRLPIEFVQHQKNLGLGETIRDVLRRASELARPDDVIVTMDADDTQSPALIPGMVRLIRDGNDVVIASRFRRGSRVVGLSLFRWFMSYAASAVFQLTFRISGVRDYTCGFRAYRACVVKEAFNLHGDSLVSERSFACSAEILLKLSRMNLTVAEVPMILRYDRKHGASKMNVAETVRKTLGLIARIRFSRLDAPYRRVARELLTPPSDHE